MSYETIRFEVDGHVATITLAREQKLNAVNVKMREELRACWQTVKSEPDIWVAILTGAGRAFSSGADVDGLAAGGSGGPDAWDKLSMHGRVRALPTPRRLLVHKPVIAAVNGLVNGVALDFVTEADIPIASEKATFFDSHVSIGYASSHEMVNMARKVPLAVCLRMGLLGLQEKMPARRAYEVGLVTEVVPHRKLMSRARELAEMLCRNAPLAMYATKMGVWRGLGLPLDQAEDVAVGYLEVVEQSEDYREGPKAFVERRKPGFRGK